MSWLLHLFFFKYQKKRHIHPRNHLFLILLYRFLTTYEQGQCILLLRSKLKNRILLLQKFCHLLKMFHSSIEMSAHLKMWFQNSQILMCYLAFFHWVKLLVRTLILHSAFWKHLLLWLWTPSCIPKWVLKVIDTTKYSKYLLTLVLKCLGNLFTTMNMLICMALRLYH